MKTSRSAVVLGMALLAGVFATGAVASAQDAQPQPQTQPQHNGQQRMLSRLQQKLGLSDAQVAAIKEVQDRHRPARMQLFKDLRDANARLRQLAVTGTDEAGLQQTAATIQSLTGQSLQLRMQTLREMAQLLSPEQRQTFAQMNFQWRGRRG